MYNAIVVGTDGSDTAKKAVAQAADLAKSTGARLHLVSAYEPIRESLLKSEKKDVPDDYQWMINPSEEVDSVLGEAADAIRGDGVEVETHSRESDPADAILDVADETSADLIVVGNRGMTGAKRFLLGSVPNKVSHHAAQSVLIVRTT